MSQPEIILDGVSEEEYDKAGSKFITFPIEPPPKKGDNQFRTVECGMLDWDTPGVSMMLPVTVTEEGPDLGKEEKISCGIKVDSIWKLKQVYEAVTGHGIPMAAGTDGQNHPAPKPLELAGKPAVGHWQIQEGIKGGVPGAEIVLYPKLVALLPAGEKPKVEDLGI